MNKQSIDKGSDRALEYAAHVMDAMQLVPRGEEVDRRQRALFDKMEEVETASEVQLAAEVDATSARDVATAVQKQLFRATRGGADLLIAADPEMESKLPIGDIFNKVDPELPAGRIFEVARHSKTEEGQLVAKIIGKLRHANGNAAEKQRGNEEVKRLAILDRANKVWALNMAAKDSELFVRLCSPKGSAALKHLQARPNRPGRKAAPGKGIPAAVEVKPSSTGPVEAVPEAAVEKAVVEKLVVEQPAIANGVPMNGASGLHELPSGPAEKQLS